MKKQDKIQGVEVADDGKPLHCPFCGNQTLRASDGLDEDWLAEPCKHVLFVAHDMAFEYRSGTFDKLMGLEGVDEVDVSGYEHGIDGLTSSVPLRGAIRFARYQGPPSRFGLYVGFAPEVAQRVGL